MCGAACAGIGQAAGDRKNTAMWTFQAGRLLGYSALGSLAAASMQGLGWMSVQTAALRPVWTLFHVATLVLGLLLIWNAQQPVWLEQAGRKIWHGARALAQGRGRGAPLVIGALWTFLPCGLLYSALLVAALTGNALDGALVMALFALGTSVSLMAGPWLWLRLRGKGTGEWGVRLAGLALVGSSAWAIWMAFFGEGGLFCVPL
jgi:sulfite exporter TauE/SafE